MTNRIFIVLLIIIHASCADKRAIQNDSISYSSENLKGGIYTSPTGDYSIDFGEKWKLTYQDSPDLSDIVISTHIIDLNDIQMLRIYRNDDNNSSLESVMNEEIQKVKENRKNFKISDVTKVNFLQYESLSIEYEYHKGMNCIERAFVMKSKNGNYYVFEILAIKNGNLISRLNELVDLLKTFESK